jgi:hypothetical protein
MQHITFRAGEVIMNDEQARVCKTVAAYFKVLTRHQPKVTDEDNSDGSPYNVAKVRTPPEYKSRGLPLLSLLGRSQEKQIPSLVASSWW